MTIHRADNENPHVVDTSYPVTFGRTVYGGYFNSESGVLTVTWGRVELSDLTWFKHSNSTETHFVYYALITGKAYGVSNFKSEDYALTNLGIGSMPDKSIKGATTTTQINICDDECSTKEAFEATLSGKYLIYELAIPVTYNLTAQEIDTLLGDNNIRCDTGDSEVCYRADISLALNS